MVNWPLLKIGHLEVNLIQGGMGVGISGENLASTIAENGGAGIIASVGLGLLKGYFDNEFEAAKKRGDFNGLTGVEKRELQNKIYANTNSDALADEIRKARRKTNGVIGVNIMYALTDYPSLVKTSVKENVDLIICGAGIVRDLPKHLEWKKTMIAQIVSSARAADIIVKSWTQLGHPPDAIVVEGPKAGGHLGYSLEQLEDSEFVSHGLESIISEVINLVGSKIPVIAAGGIYTGKDIYDILKYGAAGVQMATRFVTTKECDADPKFKQAYIDSKKEDIVIITSPVGMPGRAIKNKFLEAVATQRVPFQCYYDCLKSCNPFSSPYCIADALINAQKGNIEEGFAFAGTNAYRADKIVSVRDVFDLLEREFSNAS
ncbi:MAG: nitronate monooxygenase [Nanoarchaeota archaeon]